MQFLRKCSLATCKLQLSIKDLLITKPRFNGAASKKKSLPLIVEKMDIYGPFDAGISKNFRQTDFFYRKFKYLRFLRKSKYDTIQSYQ